MRRWLFIPLLAAAVAGPPMLMEDDSDQGPEGVTTKADAGSVFDYFGSKDDATQSGNSNSELHQDELNLLDKNSMAYAPGARDFREVFRFDANPQWLQKNWPRVSVVASQDGYVGYRVPLVTGPNPHDLTGALTYYFDRKNICQRISFSGYVGDPNRLLQLAANTFKMKPEPRLGSGIYTTEVAKQVRSLLAIQNPTIIYSDKTKQSREVKLELNNPAGLFRLSFEIQEMVRRSAQIYMR